jgi:hypothetical protein
MQPPRRGRLFAWVARKPKTAFWVIALAALFLGAAIGGSGGVDQSKLEEANARRDGRGQGRKTAVAAPAAGEGRARARPSPCARSPAALRRRARGYRPRP